MTRVIAKTYHTQLCVRQWHEYSKDLSHSAMCSTMTRVIAKTYHTQLCVRQWHEYSKDLSHSAMCSTMTRVIAETYHIYLQSSIFHIHTCRLPYETFLHWYTLCKHYSDLKQKCIYLSMYLCVCIYIYIYVAQNIKEPQIYYWKLHLFEKQTKNQDVMFSVSCVSTTCSNTCTTSRRHAGYQAKNCRPWNAPPFLLNCNTKIVKIDWLRLSSTNRSA